MKKGLLLLMTIGWSCMLFAQHESVGPITYRYTGIKKHQPTRSDNAIDSTYIYLQDTLILPLFDDFSTSKFQTFDAQPGDPNVTQELFYKLLDLSDNPLPASAEYSLSQTYRYVTTNNDTDTFDLPGVSIKIGDFSEYPVVYSTTVVYPAYHLFDTTDFVNDIDTVFLAADVMQDSATVFTVAVNDPGLYWVDRFVHRNYTMALNPWSLGVVTFDGLDETGFPYNFGSTAHGVGDFLTSKSIDLSGNSPNDSIYLSFVVQPEGLGDVPEANDSLVLEFYDSGADQWNSIWKIAGTAVTDFQRAHICIKQAIYFTNGFRFRFKNYGGLSGSLDHFHLDYIHLRKFSGYQDSIFRDFAWSYPVGSLLKEYTQVPWDHYKNNFAGKMNQEFRTVVHNGWNVANNNGNGGKVLVSYGGTTEGTFIMNGAAMSAPDLDYAPFTTYSSLHDFSGGYHYDENKPGDEVVFDITGVASGLQPDVFVGNDSCHAQQVFADCYAYDDGSAEKAYGPVGVQARLAYKFTPYEDDSLIGVRMHFVPSVVDVSNKLFLLSVWSDNNGVPGALLYEDEFFYPRTPVYEEGFNAFTTYYLKDTMKLPVTGTFYVGWRQIDANRLNLGMDMNIDNHDKIFFSLNNGVTWTNSSYAGSLMMRPIFSTALNATLVVAEPEMLPDWEVYPNPASESIAVRWDAQVPFPGAVCIDAQGRVVAITEDETVRMDLSGIPAGIYFVQLQGYGNQVKKVVKY